MQFEIDETWVADGFEMTDELAKDMIESVLGYAYPSETVAKVISAPAKKRILKAQGYAV